MQPALIPNWSVNTALRLSAACRHFSQAVGRQRGWIPDQYKTPATKRLEAAQAEVSDTQSEASEEEAPDPEASEIEDLIKKSKTLKWQSQLMESLATEFKDPNSFMVNMFDPCPKSSSEVVVVGLFVYMYVYSFK